MVAMLIIIIIIERVVNIVIGNVFASYEIVMNICVAKVVADARSSPHAVISLMTAKGIGAIAAIFVHCQDRITCTC